MKRAVSLLLSATLLLGLLSGCQKVNVKPSLEPSMEPSVPTAQALAEAAFQASGHEGEVERLTTEESGEELLSVYLENAYQLEQPWQDAAVLRATGASAFEIAVLRMEDEDAAVLAASNLMSYIYSRQGDFAGYAPAEADMVANGGLSQKGNFVGLFICPDPEGAESAFMAALDGTVGPGPEISADPDVSPGPAANTEPVFEMHDLLFRLLIEAAYPEWDSEEVKGWRDTRGDAEWMREDIEKKYGIALDQYEVGAAAWWGPTEGVEYAWFPASDYEVAVFRAVDEDGAKALADTLDGYAENRAEQLRTEGRTVNEELLQNAVIAQAGRYVLLAVCDHPQETALLFPRAVHSSETQGFFMRYIEGNRTPVTAHPDPDYPDREKFVQPGKEDMSIYDTTAILTAWEKGDPAGLSDYDRDIYDEAQSVLSGLLRDGMSDYEKELAIYGWVVDHVNYDWTHQNIMAVTSRESFTPYGGLVNRQAVCLGYAATFQLLMNLAGMECITVAGAAFHSQEDHAWNMVKLNGEWYCVDATWDASTREQIGLTGLENWDYFNATSDDMAESNHQWDYANTPEATAKDGGMG